MKITEVRDGFLKLESIEQFCVSNFILIDSDTKQYIAQVFQVKNTGTGYVLYAKILFIYNGSLLKYDKTLPNKDSKVSLFAFDKIGESFKSDDYIIAGKFLHDESDISINTECFDNKTLASIDSSEMCNIFVSNISKQFSQNNNTVIVDMLGTIEGEKYVAGRDFKLPLNTDSLSFMYEDCLNDATADSKALIKEIFNDLSEYSQTVPFLSFSALKSIVDDMVDKSHIFKLIVLKNKLAKFDKLGYFANTAADSNNLSNILKTNNAVIDLSKLDATFQNRYISVIYKTLAQNNSNNRVIINISNNINKRNLKTILTSEDVKSLLVTHSKFKYINEIKPMFKTFVVESTSNNKNVFKLYSLFLNSMKNDEYLIVGEGTNYIPLLAKTMRYEVDLPKTASHNLSNIEEFNEFIESRQNLSKEEEEEVKEENETSSKDSEENSEEVESELVANIDEQMELMESTETNEQIEFHTKVDSTKNDQEEDITLDENSEIIIEEIDESTNADEINNAIEQEEKEHIEIADEVNSEAVDEQEQDIEPEYESDDELDSLDRTEKKLLKETKNSEIEILDDSSKNEQIQEESIEENLSDNIEITDIADIESSNVVEDELIEKNIETEEQIEISDNNIEEISLPEELEDDYEVQELDNSLNTDDVDISEEPLTETSDNITNDNIEEYSELEVMPLNEQNDDVEAFVELDEESYNEGDIIVDIDEDINLQEDIEATEYEDEYEEDEDIDHKIVEDVDKVFTTIKDDSITDSDLDFIDSLNEIEAEETDFDDIIGLDTSSSQEDLLYSEDSVEELEQLTDVDEEDDVTFNETLEEVSDSSIENNELDNKEVLETRQSNTPIVPVYEAEIPPEDRVMSDMIEQGDSVTNTKYGVGVVEKMIKYGSKNLYLINFDKVGRKLLDPTVIEIKKA